MAATGNLALTADSALRTEYIRAMRNARSLFLVHVFQPSKTAGQKYDVSVYLIRDIQRDAKNQVAGFDGVEKAELDFGEGLTRSISGEQRWWAYWCDTGGGLLAPGIDSQFTGVIRPPTWFLCTQYEKWSNIGT